jgi:hypothetical protein
MQLLNSQVPLKSEETHCPICAGYGGLPNKHDPHKSHCYAGMWGVERCHYCQGVGKFKRFDLT